MQEFKKLRIKKDLNDLLDEVRGGSRPADGRWLQAFRADAIDGLDLAISIDELAVVLRMFYVFEVLTAARESLLKEARLYAEAVLAKPGEAMTRPEVLELEPDDRLPSRPPENLFTVCEIDYMLVGPLCQLLPY